MGCKLLDVDGVTIYSGHLSRGANFEYISKLDVPSYHLQSLCV